MLSASEYAWFRPAYKHITHIQCVVDNGGDSTGCWSPLKCKPIVPVHRFGGELSGRDLGDNIFAHTTPAALLDHHILLKQGLSSGKRTR